MVDALDGRRVLDGFLGCPICEARFPIRGGLVDLARGSGPGETDAPAEGYRASPEPDAAGPELDADPAAVAELIAALFDLRDGRGYILLDEALEPAAAAVAALTGGCEAIALTADVADIDGAPLAAATNRVAGVGPDLPVQTGRLRALALGAPTEARLREATRALGPEGRLVVVRPSDDVREVLRDLPVEPLADEPIAFLGVISPAR